MVCLPPYLHKSIGSSTLRSERDEEFKSGPMALSTRDGGRTTRPTERVVSFTLTEIFMMDPGRMIKLMDSASTNTSMEQDTRATGRKTSNTERELRHGPMEPVTRETMSKARSMVRENSPGPMGAHTKASSLRITSKEKVKNL
jgi:hypothetical protein